MSMSPGGDRHASKIFGFDTEEEAQTKAFNEMNPGLSQARSDLLTRAGTVSQRPYTAYTGERTAGLGGNEMTALNLARTGYGDARNYFDKAGNTIDEAAGEQWNADTQKKYMDPYVGAVVDNSLRKENTAYQQDQNALRGKAASMGAFGGSRAALLESQGQQKHLQTVGDITSKGYSDAYNNAFSSWQSDRQMKLSAANDYQSVGGDISRLNSDQIQNLMQTGQADRVVRQLGDDNTYSAFIEKRDWDLNNLQPLMSAVSAVGGGTQVKAGAPTSNGAADTLGMISTLVGYFGQKSGNTGYTNTTPNYGYSAPSGTSGPRE